MNKLDFYCYIYSRFRNYGMPKWVLTPIRRLIRRRVNFVLPQYLSIPTHVVKSRADVIVSLTSFPARINNVWQVVECMLRQTQMPSKILLWLSKEQFPNIDSIPIRLRNMENDVFEIRIVEGNIRSHKKYLYASIENPDSLLLLIDDDIYYPTYFLSRMLNAYRQFRCVVCNYGFLIRYRKDGTVAPYSTWQEQYTETDSNDFFFGSGGGVLFKPKDLYKDLTNIDLALELTPFADDIWLNAMVRIAGLKTYKLESGLILPINNGINNITLASHNLSRGGNDEQLNAINDYYEKIIGKKIFYNYH